MERSDIGFREKCAVSFVLILPFNFILLHFIVNGVAAIGAHGKLN